MKKIFLLSLLILGIQSLFAQIKIRDSIFVKINKLEAISYSFAMSEGRISLVNVYIKNKYQDQSGFTSGQFGSNLTLKQKHKLDPSKVITYAQYVELINKDFLTVLYYYKVFFIISEAKYDYLTLQVRQISPPEFNQE